MERALYKLAALSGLSDENFNRVAGWNFLDLGKRIVIHGAGGSGGREGPTAQISAGFENFSAGLEACRFFGNCFVFAEMA